MLHVKIGAPHSEEFDVKNLAHCLCYHQLLSSVLNKVQARSINVSVAIASLLFSALTSKCGVRHQDSTKD